MSNSYQWLWKSNSDPWQINTEEQWERYSDIETTIIESAFQKNCSNVELDNFIIDLKCLIQINKMDETKQRPIKRISRANLQCLREEQFAVPSRNDLNQQRKSFGEESRWMSPRFIEEWSRRYPRISIQERVNKATKVF